MPELMPNRRPGVRGRLRARPGDVARTAPPALLDIEADKQRDVGRSTEKRSLLLSGLMLADTMTALEDKLAATEDRLRAAEERVRIADAKSAMLAANALKLETEASHRGPSPEVARLRQENEAAPSCCRGAERVTRSPTCARLSINGRVAPTARANGRGLPDPSAVGLADFRRRRPGRRRHRMRSNSSSSSPESVISVTMSQPPTNSPLT